MPWAGAPLSFARLLGDCLALARLPAPLWGLSFVRLVDHAVGAALDGAPVAPAATFADGVAVQRVLDAVRQASRTGWVRVEP